MSTPLEGGTGGEQSPSPVSSVISGAEPQPLRLPESAQRPGYWKDMPPSRSAQTLDSQVVSEEATPSDSPVLSPLNGQPMRVPPVTLTSSSSSSSTPMDYPEHDAEDDEMTQLIQKIIAERRKRRKNMKRVLTKLQRSAVILFDKVEANNCVSFPSA